MSEREKLVTGSLLKKHGAWHHRRYINKKQVTRRVADGDKLKAQVIRDINAEHQNERETPVGDDTLITAFAEKHYFPGIEKTAAAATLDGYKKIWRQHLEPHFAGVKFSDVRFRGVYSAKHARRFLEALMPKYSHWTVQHIRALMNNIFNEAFREEICAYNPLHKLELKGNYAETPETQHYTLDEMKLTLAALDSDEHARARIVMLLAFLGLRRSEIEGLRWDDVDYSTQSLKVNRSSWRGKVSPGAKNKQSKRDVTFGKIGVDSLRRQQKHSTSVAGYVFEGPRKGPLDIGAYGDNTLRPLFKELGLTWRGFHSGRRSGVTEMRAYGKSEDVSFHFGHSVAIANALYDAGRIEATRKAALSYANSLQETNERQN